MLDYPVSGLYFPLVGVGDGGLEHDQSTGPYGLYAAILHSTSPLHYTACIRVVENGGVIKYMLYNDANKPRLVPMEEVAKFSNVVVLIYQLEKTADSFGPRQGLEEEPRQDREPEQRDNQGSDVAGIEAISRLVCGSISGSSANMGAAENAVEAGTDRTADSHGLRQVLEEERRHEQEPEENAVLTFNGTPSIGQQRGSHFISFASMSDHDILLIRSIRAVIQGPPIDASVFPLHADLFYSDYLQRVAPSGTSLSILASTFKYIAAFLQFYVTSSEGVGCLKLGPSKIRAKYSLDVISLKHSSLHVPTDAVFFKGSMGGRITYDDATSKARRRSIESGEIVTVEVSRELNDVGGQGGVASVCSMDTEAGLEITNNETGMRGFGSAEDRLLAPTGTADGSGGPFCVSTFVAADETGVVIPQKKLRTYSNGAPARLLLIINNARLSAAQGTTYRSWVYELFSNLVKMSEVEPGFILLLKLLDDAEVCLQGAGGAGRDGKLLLPLSEASANVQESLFVAKLSALSFKLTAVRATPARKTWAETFGSPTATAAAGAAGAGAAVGAAVESCEKTSGSKIQRELMRKRDREESQYVALEHERKKEQARINGIDVALIESV